MTTLGDMFYSDLTGELQTIKDTAASYAVKYELSLGHLGALANAVEEALMDYVRALNEREEEIEKENEESEREWEQIRRQDNADYLLAVGMPR